MCIEKRRKGKGTNELALPWKKKRNELHFGDIFFRDEMKAA
jgi:hypothetical protein